MEKFSVEQNATGWEHVALGVVNGKLIRVLGGSEWRNICAAGNFESFRVH